MIFCLCIVSKFAGTNFQKSAWTHRKPAKVLSRILRINWASVSTCNSNSILDSISRCTRNTNSNRVSNWSDEKRLKVNHLRVDAARTDALTCVSEAQSPEPQIGCRMRDAAEAVLYHVDCLMYEQFSKVKWLQSNNAYAGRLYEESDY